MRHDEHNLQVKCVWWFRLQYPSLSKLLWAIPNGGARDIITGKRLKDEGVVAGAPDLVLMVKNGEYSSAHFELKTEKGKQSQNQKEIQLLLEKYGNYYVICRSLPEFINEIKNYLEKC